MIAYIHSSEQQLSCCLQISTCSGTYNIQLEQLRAACLLAAFNLHRLVRALLAKAPARQMRAIQGIEDWQPSSTVNTCIIRHRHEVHKYVYAWDSFVSRFGHSFKAVQVRNDACCQQIQLCMASLHLKHMQDCSPYLQEAYAVANERPAMVSTDRARETPALLGPVRKTRTDGRALPREHYLKVVLSRVGWSRQVSSLAEEDFAKVK